jgi:hypothetical protein
MSGRNLPRRLSSQGTLGPQQQDKSARHNRGTQNKQKQKQQHQKQKQQHQKQQHQKQLASALSGVNPQRNRRNSMDALKNSFLSWHREEKHEASSGTSTDAIHGTSSARTA